ncbi:MAG: ABC transporter ATP-binding protein [Chloroflexi bacterium]|jgi:ABC-type nitrate/sulfonate/bicarbonate transport system ATPase subunit|nr:ABC transporter ATP-binding protein [Chloroflexota bacterium]MBT5627710.1 ABC transporter ATP-binding protein [Chloroflexota bacterium]
MSSARPNTETRTNNGASSVDESALVSVSGVGFDYEDAPILENVNLAVERGEFVALVGPSGCGKSTILNLISGVLSPRDGMISADGMTNRSDRLGNVSYMQQKDLLLPWRTVAENSRLGLEIRGVRPNESNAAVEKLAESFGIADVLDSMPWQLSGGMRQRVALLRAVLPDNPVLLLDEPFGALDAITRRSLQHWLLNVLDTANKAVVLVTHDVEEAILLADRVLVMSSNPGQIIDEISIDLDGTTTNGDTTTSPEFIELKKRIMASLGDQEMTR